jgi:ABC-type amino acid transport substrate-binding protein
MVYGAIVFIAVVICVSGGVWLSNIMFPSSPTEPAAKEPVTEEPVADEFITDEQAAKEPAGKQGSIRIGVRGDVVWPLNMFDGTSHSGFEIDLAEEIVRRLYSEPVSIEWVSLTAADRFPALQNGDIDMLIRTTSHTISREEFGLWTSNYFLDGARLLVPINSGIENIKDLDGGLIAVTAGTTTELQLRNAAIAAGINYEPIVFENINDVYNAFVDGRADAIISDWSYLLTLSQDDSNYHVIGELLSSEPFGIGIPLNQPEFRDEVDSVLLEIIADGTWQNIYDRWFTEPPPWTLDEMLAEPSVNR